MAMNDSQYREYIDMAVEKAIEKNNIASAKAPKDAYKATERRLYSIPVLRIRIADKKEELEELLRFGPKSKSKSVVRYQRDGNRLDRDEVIEALATNARADIASDEYEVEELMKAMSIVENDPYFLCVKGRYELGLTDEQIAAQITCDTTTVWRTRKRLIQRISVRLYGASVSAR